MGPRRAAVTLMGTTSGSAACPTPPWSTRRPPARPRTPGRQFTGTSRTWTTARAASRSVARNASLDAQRCGVLPGGAKSLPLPRRWSPGPARSWKRLYRGSSNFLTRTAPSLVLCALD